MRPTGLLRLRFDNWFHSPVRHEWWNETEEKPLENRLREVIIGLFFAAAAERRRADERVEQERKRFEAFEEEERRWRLEERRRKQRARVEALLKEADAWVQARRLRGYIDATCAHPDEKWKTWARGIADAIDPAPKRF